MISFFSVFCFFPFLVTLIHPIDGQEVGKGTIIKREQVHGHCVKEDEVAVSVVEIIGYDEIIQPDNSYEVCAGGYTAWKKVNCCLRQ